MISDADILSSRAALEIVLVHRCTVIPLVPGTEDDEGNIPLVPGTPVTGVPCSYLTDQRVTINEGGRTLVYTSTLLASATGPVAVGVNITNITGQLGSVLDAGPLRVERVLDQTAGLGDKILPLYGLKAGAVSA